MSIMVSRFRKDFKRILNTHSYDHSNGYRFKTSLKNPLVGPKNVRFRVGSLTWRPNHGMLGATEGSGL